jgi:Flp pilus assembly protein TadG
MQRLYLISRLRKFAEDTRAVAAVEFALVLPLMLALYLGSVEAARLYTADRKVATIASSMADLVSREKGSIKKTTLDDYFKAAANTMQPYSDTDLGQVVTLVKIASDGKATVSWSAKYGTATARNANDDFPLASTTKINALAKNADGWLIAAEVTYPYQPILGYIISDTVNLKHVEYYLPRFEDQITYDTAN